MANESRADTLKAAVSILLKNLVNADWVGVVIFESNATTFQPKLVRATSENINL